MRLFMLIWLMFYLAPFENTLLASELEGRYRGYLLPDKNKAKIPLQLDFFPVATHKFSAILKLSLGHFESHEYISQYYKELSCADGCREIILAEDDWDLSLFELKLTDQLIKGRFRSHSGYEQGQILLQKFEEPHDAQNENRFEHLQAFPEILSRPVFPLLSGQYQGLCDGKKTYLQLEASKWFSIINPVQTPFYGYKFTGRVGSADGSCGDMKAVCIHDNFFDGTFNPYRGFIKVTGQPHSVRFSLKDLSLQMDGCKLKKTLPLDLGQKPGKFTDHNTLTRIEEWKKSNQNSPEFIKDQLDGYYKGFLYHRQLDRYQFMDLSVESIVAPTDSESIDFYPSAWLHFESPDGLPSSKISFPFKQVRFRPEVPYMLWDSGMDVLAKIDRWEKDFILGQWVSRTFGVVGPFILAREGASLPIEMDGPRVKSVLGLYSSEHWTLELFGLEDRDPDDVAIFFPVQLYGGAHIPGLTEMKTVDAGVYDFYSGSIAFQLSDKRVVTGNVYEHGLMLFWPANPRWGVKLLPLKLQSFQHVKSRE